MLGIDAWTVFGVLLIVGYGYWVYTDLVRPWLADDEPYEWEDGEEPSGPDRQESSDDDE